MLHSLDVELPPLTPSETRVYKKLSEMIIKGKKTREFVFMLRKMDSIPSTGYLTKKLIIKTLTKFFEQLDAHSDSGVN
jgi:hypothetical protein